MDYRKIKIKVKEKKRKRKKNNNKKKNIFFSFETKLLILEQFRDLWYKKISYQKYVQGQFCHFLKKYEAKGIRA